VLVGAKERSSGMGIESKFEAWVLICKKRQGRPETHSYEPSERNRTGGGGETISSTKGCGSLRQALRLLSSMAGKGTLGPKKEKNADLKGRRRPFDSCRKGGPRESLNRDSPPESFSEGGVGRGTVSLGKKEKNRRRGLRAKESPSKGGRGQKVSNIN